MKKITLSLVVLAMACLTQAQVSVGVHGNVIGASMKNSADDPNEDIKDFDTRFSWKFGLVAQTPISTNIYFMPQLNVLSKGGKIDDTQTLDLGTGSPVTATMKANAKLTYVELPLNFIYSASGEEGGFFIGVGPTLGLGISGKVEGDVSGSFQNANFSEPFERDVKFDGKKDDEVDQNDKNIHFKRLDIGANVLVGYLLANGVFINAHYNYGFSNIEPNSGYESKNRYFGVGIGYFFNRQ